MTHHKWTEDEREIVRRDYQGTNESAHRIADRLGVSFWGVKGQLQRMGVTFHPDKKQWTPIEEERLAKLIGKYPKHIVARKMRRGINSVVVKSKRMGLSWLARDGWYTKREVCEILGVNHRWVQTRIESGDLKATWHGATMPQKNGGSSWHIEQEDLKMFIRKYPGELHGRNVDMIQIVEILAGILI